MHSDFPHLAVQGFIIRSYFIRKRYLPGSLTHTTTNFQLFEGEKLLDSGQGKNLRNVARLYTPANQQVVMRRSRQALLFAWARTRPQWQPEYERLRQRYNGYASEQEVEVVYLT